MEAGILQALVPTQKGRLEWDHTDISYKASYDTGSEVITKSSAGIMLCITWLAKVEASLKSGNSAQGVTGMKKSTVADEDVVLQNVVVRRYIMLYRLI